LPESLKPSIGGSEPLWLVGPAVLAVVLVVWMEADGGVVGGRVIKLVIILARLAPGSA
jgi:hypothetical protein